MGLIDMIVNMKGDNMNLADLSRATAHDEKLIGMFATYQRIRLHFGLWQLRLLLPLMSPHFMGP